ncbi:MAG: alpha/beta hydrolase [Candidatus Delongbacteria bacterium]|nr:alpha/beta hydrolase [Candidatus Delongbacteria bacterium]
MKKILVLILASIVGFVSTGCTNSGDNNSTEVWFYEQVELFTIEQEGKSITEDFELPIAFNGIDISWDVNSNLVAILNEEGKIFAKISQSASDEDVVLEATLKYEEYSSNKSFTITVLALEEVDENTRIIRLNVTIPEALKEGDTLTIGSNINGWNPSNLDYTATKITDTLYELELKFDSQTSQIIEYKWTIQNPLLSGAWDMVEKASDGKTEVSNRRIVITSSSDLLIVINDVVLNFADPNEVAASTVVGNLDIIDNFYSPELNRSRTIRVWTPSGYDSNDLGKKYPVIYMHDGQNLFDERTSFAGEWGIDESIEDFIGKTGSNGYIIVGIDNTAARMSEYTPDWSDKPSSEGGKYGQFIVETLKPYIDQNYNTLTERNSTGIAGSSMGGLISFYVGLKYPEVFGMIGAFSTSFQINTEAARNEFIESLDLEQPLPRLYLDAGTLESLYTYVGPVSNKLFQAGYPGELIFTYIQSGHGHNEAAWRERFPIALTWLDSDNDGNYFDPE